MPSSYTTSLRFELQAPGENNQSWGIKANGGVFALADKAIAGFTTIALTDADHTLTTANGAEDQSRYAMLNINGALTEDRTITLPAVSKIYIVRNVTTGGFGVNFKIGAGTPYRVPPSPVHKLIYTNGGTIWSSDDFTTRSTTSNRWGIPGFIDQTTGSMDIGRYVDFHNADVSAGDFAVRLGTLNASGVASAADLFITPSSPGGSLPRKVWNDGNDGPASGLNADMVDNIHAEDLGFPAGTEMLFMQPTAPTSWTKRTTHSNKALRIVAGSGGGSGGTVAFTTAFASKAVVGNVGTHALTEAELPEHRHEIHITSGTHSNNHTHGVGTYDVSGGGGHDHEVKYGQGVGGLLYHPAFATFSIGLDLAGAINAGTGTHTHGITGNSGLASAGHTHDVDGFTETTGSGTAHDHSFSGTPIDLAVQYVDAIICVKDVL